MLSSAQRKVNLTLYIVQSFACSLRFSGATTFFLQYEVFGVWTKLLFRSLSTQVNVVLNIQTAFLFIVYFVCHPLIDFVHPFVQHSSSPVCRRNKTTVHKQINTPSHIVSSWTTPRESDGAKKVAH